MRMKHCSLTWAALTGGLIIGVGSLLAQTFSVIFSRMTAAKPEVIKRHSELLQQRYDLSDRPAQGITMSRSKPLQQGARVKLPGSAARGAGKS